MLLKITLEIININVEVVIWQFSVDCEIFYNLIINI